MEKKDPWYIRLRKWFGYPLIAMVFIIYHTQRLYKLQPENMIDEGRGWLYGFFGAVLLAMIYKTFIQKKWK